MNHDSSENRKIVPLSKIKSSTRKEDPEDFYYPEEAYLEDFEIEDREVDMILAEFNFSNRKIN